MAGASIIPLPRRQDDGWIDGEFDNESADDGTLSPSSPCISDMTPTFEQLRRFDVSPRSSPTQNTIHRPVSSQPDSPTGFPHTRGVEMASNNLDASWFQEFLPHQHPISPQNTSPEERINLPCPSVISSNGPRSSSELPLTRSPEMMGYSNLDRSRDQELPMLHYPLSPQNTPTQECIHLPVPEGSQLRSPTGSPFTRRREMAYSSLLYQEFHSIFQFFVSAQNSPTQQREQLPRQPIVHPHELTLSPTQDLQHIPCSYQTSGVNPALFPRGPILQTSRIPTATFDEHAILHPTLHRPEFTLPPILNLDCRDGMPIPRVPELETLTLVPYRAGMAGFIADPTTDLIVARDGRTVISRPTLPRLASLDDITSAREMEGMDSMDTDSDLDSMYSDPMYTMESMDSDLLNSDSMYSDNMYLDPHVHVELHRGQRLIELEME